MVENYELPQMYKTAGLLLVEMSNAELLAEINNLSLSRNDRENAVVQRLRRLEKAGVPVDWHGYRTVRNEYVVLLRTTGTFNPTPVQDALMKELGV